MTDENNTTKLARRRLLSGVLAAGGTGVLAGVEFGAQNLVLVPVAFDADVGFAGYVCHAVLADRVAMLIILEDSPTTCFGVFLSGVPREGRAVCGTTLFRTDLSCDRGGLANSRSMTERRYTAPESRISAPPEVIISLGHSLMYRDKTRTIPG